MSTSALNTKKDRELIEFVLSGNASTYLNNPGVNILDRLELHSDWWGGRYKYGLDPYSKSSAGPILPEIHACDRLGKKLAGVNMASQDYLSLSSHPKIKEAAVNAISQYGVHSAGSPTLMGNSIPSLLLEQALAEFVHMKDCTVFPTGWAAGYGLIRALIRFDDHIVIDALAHACLVEGAKNATKNVHTFKHNSMEDLEKKLKHIRQGNPSSAILVVTESLFSMDSDTPDLRVCQELTNRFQGTLMVDVAHDLGCSGKTGNGNIEIQGMLGKIDLVMGSFSKTFASNGGFVASNSNALKVALRFGSGPLTFSNAISPIQASVVFKALEIVQSAEGDHLREKLMNNILELREKLTNNNFSVLGNPSPIVPVITGSSGRARLVSHFSSSLGALVNLVEHPAVARDTSRLRLQVMANHTSNQIDNFVNILKAACQAADKECERLEVTRS